MLALGKAAHVAPLASSTPREIAPNVLSREFRTKSMLSLKTGPVDASSFWDEARHSLTCLVKLWPSIICVTLGIASNTAVRRNALPEDPRALPVFAYASASLTFSLAVRSVYRRLGLSRLQTTLAMLAKDVPDVIIMSIGVWQGFPWSLVRSTAYACASYGISALLSLYAAMLTQKARLCSFKTHFVAWTIGLNSALGVAVIAVFGLLTHVSHVWYVEWLIAGVAIPSSSLLFGRVLIADFNSFALLWGFSHGSCISVMSFFGFLVKVGFYLAGQIAILEVRSSYAFVLSLVMAAISEIVGTYVNIRFTCALRAKAHLFPLDPTSQHVLRQWLAVRAALSGEKLILYTHDKSIGEKLVICAAVAAILIPGSDAPFSVAGRGACLLVAETIQDIVQRRLLLHMAGLTISGLKPRYLTFEENVNMTCFVVMTINIYGFSDSLSV